jgi:hypothetical protein
MRKLAIAAFVSLAIPRAAFATWSIIAIDIRTGQVIIGSANCVRQMSFPQLQPNGARDLMDIQAVIVPGIGIAAFALTLKVLGLILATALAVMISSLADNETRWKGRILLAIGVAAITYLVFGFALGMVLPAWPWNT